MAGIYIPDIEFPPYPWTGMVVLVLKDDGTAHYTKAETLEQKTVNFTVVPPHGDLIDLSEKIIAQYYDEMTEEWLEKEVTVEDVLYGCIVDKMPSTIIPADPSEEVIN